MQINSKVCLLVLGCSFLQISSAASNPSSLETKVNNELTTQTNIFNTLNTELKSKEILYSQSCEADTRQCSAIKGQITQINQELKPLQADYQKTCASGDSNVLLECNALQTKISSFQSQSDKLEQHYNNMSCNQPINKQYCNKLQANIGKLKGQMTATQNNIKVLERQADKIKNQ